MDPIATKVQYVARGTQRVVDARPESAVLDGDLRPPRRGRTAGEPVIDTVELTINEVIHAGDFPLVDLIVVDGIVPVRDESNEVIDAVGGRLRVWTNWSPVEDMLKAMKFAYSLPGSSETA